MSRDPALPVVAVVSLVISGCAGSGTGASSTTAPTMAPTTASTSATATTEQSMSQEALAYLEEALGVMMEQSINRDVVDWVSLEESTLRLAAGAQTPDATYPAIRLALDLLADDHSVFLTPAESESFSGGDPVFTDPVVETVEEELGYVSIGGYLGDIGAPADAYAADLSGRVGSVDADVCGWIVDLRSNSGGNMWPMIAGLSPLLGAGVVGSFTYPDGREEPWEIEGDATYWGDMPMVAVGQADPGGGEKPVAVLIGSSTASAGEAVTVAFHGRDGAVLIGEPTAGLTTSNEPVALSDGALLILTMSSFTDRHGQRFGQDTPVEPDIEEPALTAQERAVEWLFDQEACQG